MEPGEGLTIHTKNGALRRVPMNRAVYGGLVTLAMLGTGPACSSGDAVGGA